MFGTLLRKQMLELNKFFFQNKKTGEVKSKASAAKSIIMFAVLMFFIAFAFFGMCIGLVSSFHSTGYDWMYFLIVAAMSILLGAFGSVFNTYASLYKAGDNDLLLSLPIKPDAIIAVRLVGVFIMGLLYEATVVIPGILVYWLKADFGIVAALSQIAMIFVLALIVLVISVVLGYVVAVISTKIKSKALISAFASLAVIAVYYVSYFKMQVIIKDLSANAAKYGDKIKSSASSMYYLGNSFLGDTKSFIGVVSVTIALLAVVYVILRASFVKLSTKSSSEAKKKLKQSSYRVRTADNAFVTKEVKRFFSSPAYMMNTGLGLLIMPVMAVAAVIKSKSIVSMIAQIGDTVPNIQNFVGVIIAAVICLVCAMCTITAPSISLEGKAFYLLKTLPLAPKTVIFAKLKAHILLCSIPALISTVVLCAVLKCGVLSAILSVLFVVAFIWLSGVVGLYMNLRYCNLEWTNEVVPIKQSLSVLFTIVIGICVALAYGAGSFFIGRYVNIDLVSVIFALVLVIIDVLLTKHLKTIGTRLFAEI